MSSYNNRTSQSYSRGYRASPFGVSPSKSGNAFDPNAESLDAPGAFLSPDLTLARRDPFNHYILRSGGYRGKTVASAHTLNSTYLTWMKRKHYSTLPSTHIVYKFLDQ